MKNLIKRSLLADESGVFFGQPVGRLLPLCPVRSGGEKCDGDSYKCFDVHVSKIFDAKLLTNIVHDQIKSLT